MDSLANALAFGLGAIGPAFGLAIVGSKTIESWHVSLRWPAVFRPRCSSPSV